MSTITENIQNIINAKASIKEALANKGVTVPEAAKLAEYGIYVNNIEQGGGGIGEDDTDFLKNLMEGTVETIVIPEGATTIRDCACEELTALTEVTIPNSVTSIGSSAFEKCSSLKNITIPNSVTSIGGSAFNNCSSLTEVTISNPEISIYGWAFALDSLNGYIPLKINLSGNESFIGSDVFSYRYVENLKFSYYNAYTLSDCVVKNLELLPSYKEIPSYFLYNSYVFNPIIIPDGLTFLDESFIGVKNVFDRLPETNTKPSYCICHEKTFEHWSNKPDIIGESPSRYVFTSDSPYFDLVKDWMCYDGNVMVNSVFNFWDNNLVYNNRFIKNTPFECVMPEGITDIDFSPHDSYASFREYNFTLVLPTTLTNITNFSKTGGSLIKVTNFENTQLTSIGNDAFTDMYYLLEFDGNTRLSKPLIFPETLKRIENSAFKNVLITYVEIPSSIEYIGEDAFTHAIKSYGKARFRCVIKSPTPPELRGTKAFKSSYGYDYIYVPDESVELYKTATNWTAYATKIHPISELGNPSQYYKS